MSDPYRDPDRPCPSCKAPLRAFRARFVCDACEGMLAPLADLSAAIEDITGVVPSFDYVDEAPGKRPCPLCAAPMTAFKLRIHLDDELAKPPPQLDRCAQHGIWFDTDELAAVFEKARAKHPGGGGAISKTRDPVGTAGSWSGDRKGPFWFGGGHGNY
ncbi:MAG: zf-TFIIB domain-containing protein [Myxococcales bacterium]|nr:zf-TFIIB domain-containing protein [Myxococcales bacterium]